MLLLLLVIATLALFHLDHPSRVCAWAYLATALYNVPQGLCNLGFLLACITMPFLWPAFAYRVYVWRYPLRAYFPPPPDFEGWMECERNRRNDEVNRAI